MTRVYGVVEGVVRNVDDPDGQGRVLVGLPWLGGSDDESYWAPVATLMTGDGHGSWFMPEVDDEVLVAFRHGNVEEPRVIGYLWNGVQRPPSDGGHSVRRLKTVSGHVLEFHDEGGEQKIVLRSNGGQTIELDDGPGSTTGSITVQTAGGQSVELTDGPPAATVRAGGSEVQLEMTGVRITAAAVTIDAPIATFTGVLQATTVIAASVVGAAYTPAPGNTLGL